MGLAFLLFTFFCLMMRAASYFFLIKKHDILFIGKNSNNQMIEIQVFVPWKSIFQIFSHLKT